MLSIVRALGLFAILLLPAVASADDHARKAGGPVIAPEQMNQVFTRTADECAAYRFTVYVETSGIGLCFRYHLSVAGGSSDQVVYFLNGDKPEGQLVDSPAALDRFAGRLSTEFRLPAVYLARMGYDGSSGSHLRRRTWLEVESTRLAIDAINARHGFRTIHVFGQSGGAHLTGSLVGLRSDIGCAVPGSGRLAFDQEYLAGQAKRLPAFRHYNPDSAVDEVVRRSVSTRILVVTDLHDRTVPASMQTPFVSDVRQRGGRIAQFFVEADDPDHHDAVPYARRAMAACLAGASDLEIASALDRLSTQRVQLAHQRAQPALGLGKLALAGSARASRVETSMLKSDPS